MNERQTFLDMGKTFLMFIILLDNVRSFINLKQHTFIGLRLFKYLANISKITTVIFGLIYLVLGNINI